MIQQEPMQARLSMLAKEHRTINKQIRNLKQFWFEVDELGYGPKYEELKRRFQEFGELLAAHFALEEQVFQDLQNLVNAERGEMVQRLTVQHAGLLERLLENIERVQRDCAGWNTPDWERLGDEIEDFIDCLSDHEASETALIHQCLESEDFISGVA